MLAAISFLQKEIKCSFLLKKYLHSYNNNINVRAIQIEYARFLAVFVLNNNKTYYNEIKIIFKNYDFFSSKSLNS